MSINIFLSDKLPKERNKLLTVISFNKKIDYANNILSAGVPSINGKNLYEIWEVKDKVDRSTYNNIDVSRNKYCLFGSIIIDNKGSYEEIRLEIQKKYLDFFKISNENGMRIVKIWHYLPELLKAYPDKKTNYSLLCESREEIYRNFYKNSDYPAATVIGIEGNKILIYFLAASCETYEVIENERQVSSYNYPQNIFSEKPMFSRAVSFSFKDNIQKKIMISGTASIKGYESVHESDVAKQLDEALKNYKTFAKLESNPSNICRVYLTKYQTENLSMVAKKLENFFGTSQYILLQGDICRSELLIEIEGVSNA